MGLYKSLVQNCYIMMNHCTASLSTVTKNLTLLHEKHNKNNSTDVQKKTIEILSLYLSFQECTTLHLLKHNFIHYFLTCVINVINMWIYHAILVSTFFYQ
jgi:hypothetical protein